MKRLALIAVFFINLTFVTQNIYGQIAEKKQIETIRIETPPKIDAILDDDAWKKQNNIANKFVQLVPYNGDPASFDSQVKIVYDDRALYIGAFLEDPYPDSIYTELSERDDFGMADNFGIYLDCYNDYLTAFGFFVTSAGVQVDRKSTASNEVEKNWDAVWDSEVKIVENGWIVEMKIPYSAIRFPKDDEQIWGLQIYRNIMRYRENTTWNFINREEDGINNQSGELHGIKNVNPPLRLSFVPYLSGYLEKSPESKNWGYSYNYGLDFKLGLNESYTLDMTLIPDFGQVVSDDQIYNLTPFEVYYEERRPFFMEGTELFNKGNVFYSRRVGKTPSGYYDVEDSLSEGEKITANPQNAQLINATKISGKSSKKLAIGFFNGMSANTWAQVTDTINGNSRNILTEPFTNYNMLVFDQALKHNSYISLFNTNTYQPDNKYSSNVTGGELKLNTRQNNYGIWTQGMVSQKYKNGSEPEFGYSYSIVGGKISGNFTFEASHRVIDDKYDPNDMGYLRHNNVISDNLGLSYNIYKPTWKILDMYNSVWLYYEQLYNPRTFTNFRMGFRVRTTFRRHLSAWLNGNFSPVETYNYYEPRVDGRYFKNMPYVNASLGFSPDYRKRFLIDWRFGVLRSKIYDEFSYWLTVSPRFRVNDNLRIILRMSYRVDQNDIGYVTDSTNIEDQNVIIFGTRDIDTYENTLEADYRFNNKSSIAFRLRHYWITLKYNEYFNLNNDGTLAYTDYNSINDFSVNIFNIDAQYIWNFAPGSEIRVVWKNSINTYDEPETINSILYPIEQNFGRNLVNTFQSPATNSFSIKLLYYFDYQYLRKGSKRK